MEKSSDKLVVCRFRDGVLSTWFQSGRAAELEFSRAHETEVGAIYLARVSHVQKNINAAFLDIGKGVNAYLNLEKAKKVRLANGEPADRITEGTELLVEIKKDAHAKKGYTAVAARFRKDDPVLSRAAFLQAPRCLKPAPKAWEQLLAACLRSGNPLELITDLPEVYEQLSGSSPEEMPEYRKKLPERFQGEELNTKQLNEQLKLRYYADAKLSLPVVYGLETVVQSALARRVWLPSGGNIVIERTEALTVIDVNSGKDVRGKDKEATLSRTNREAAEELMHQLRLRNLSGIILVDFIDFAEQEHLDALVDTLETLAAKDTLATKFVDITGLNLAELVRPRRGKSIQEQFFSPNS